MKRRSYSKLVTAVHSMPWAILPEKLQDICGILDLRQRGVKLTRAEIRARVGDLEHPPLVQHVPAAAIVSQQALTTQPRIAVLNLYGTIAQRMNMMMEYSGGTSTELFGKAFDQAVADESVVAIVINVDSPGGTVPGTRELAEKIYAARGSKTIIAIANPMCASAAYWIASAADEVVSQPSGVGIGSIGVLNVHREESKANEEAGITFTVLRSVEQKAAANPWEPLSEAARHDLQANVEKTHEQFAAAVAKHRGIKVSAVDEKFGEGRSYQAQDALSRGLIDRIVTFEALLTELSGRADAQSSPSAAKKRRQSTAKESAMDPKVKAALVRAGLARANATDEEFKAALALHYACLGKPEATDVAQLVADIEPKLSAATTTLQPSVTNANGNGGAVAQLAGVSEPKGLSAREIMGLVASAGAMLSAEDKLNLQKELVSSATPLSLDQVLDKINAKVTTENPVVGQRITVTADRIDKFQAAARDEILAATWGPGDRPKEIFDFRSRQMKAWEGRGAGQNYGLQTPVKIAQQCMLECGVSPSKVLGLSKADIAQLICGADPMQMGHGQLFASVDGPAYNVSGMFSNILLDATNVILRRSYNDGKTTYQVWMRNAPSIEDFKPVHKVIAGELGDPKAIPEDGEFEEVTLSDGKESYKLVLWGEIFSHSWELLTNDRLGSLTEIPVKMGRAFKRKQNRLAYGVLKDNAALADTVALFHSSHSNATTGALTTSADYTGAFGTMSKKMREQRGLDSVASAALNLSPRWVIFPPAIRDKMLIALGSTSIVTSANSGEINIWKGMLEPVEEAELGSAAGGSETAFYQAADHADIDTIEYAFLQGLEAPRLEQAVAFTRLAIRQRMFQAFAIKAIDYRGLQRHTGA